MDLSGEVGELHLQRAGADVATLPIREQVEVRDAQIGSMFVTDEEAKTVLGRVPARTPTVVVDGREVSERWDVARIRVPMRLLSRWQQAKLQWAPMLRRVSVRFRLTDDRVRLRVRRCWPR